MIRSDRHQPWTLVPHLSGLALLGLVSKDLLMEESDLPGARFDRAYMLRAVLIGSRLTGASIVQATLTGAALEDVDLSGANLRGSLLNGAHLRGARFQGAQLADARFVNAVHAGADFKGALEMPEHLRAMLGPQ
jgi:uncharacterized protein YjbI with pentapeptide repeats